VYDAEGKYMLTESSPANTQDGEREGARARRSGVHPAEAKAGTRAVAAEALAGMAGK